MSAVDRHVIHRYTLLALLAWLLLVGGSVYWNYAQQQTVILERARDEARNSISKDLAFRRWATSHGGVYVPPDADTLPNPYLKVPDRDVTTTTGRALTLMNPAYMVRQMQQRFGDPQGVRGHITSLDPLNPANAPDAWEIEALKAFEHGTKEVSAVADLDGRSHMRVIRAMFVEKGCLKCHARQGYAEGDVRGGISASVPLAPYLADSREERLALFGSHGAIWLVGMLVIAFFNRRAMGRLEAWERVEEELRLAASVFRSAAEGIVVTDRDGRIVSVNGAFAAITGYSEDEVVGRDPSLLKSGRHDAAFYAALWAEIVANGHWQGVIWNRRKDGEVYPEWLSITAVRDGRGQVVNYTGIFTDIGERLRAEQEVRELNESLEQRVRQRTGELEQANRELESFSYSVSHDLRAPLRALNGYAKIIGDEERARVSPEGQHMLERIRVNAEKMGALIDDILQFSRIGRSGMTLAPVNMTALAKAVAAELAADYPAARVVVGDLPTVAGDEAMLRQVWVNLIGNALKFSAKREGPAIQVGAREEGGAPVFFVRDNGAGFDMAAADRLFGVFQRLHREEDFPGTGAGLAIVKRIVERHGGRVWAEAAVEQGATFSFTIGSAVSPRSRSG